MWFDGWIDVKLEFNKWYYFALTVDNGLVRVYINGEKGFKGEKVQDILKVEKDISVLGVNWWAPPFKGRIDKLRI